MAVDDVDFLKGNLHVVRQLKIVGSRLVYALPRAARRATFRCPSRWALPSPAIWKSSPRCR
ncbi:hypothetical protein [Micromonospora maritima]|uniref:hypothetical protein n=1 Tax=Micromonospora maritima TaxID=986711 RepID=UPI0037970607